LPLFVAGYAANFIPSFFSHFYANRLKDDQFKSSFQVVLRLVLYIVYYILVITALSIIFKSLLIVVCATAASILLSRFVLFYRLWFRDISHKIRFFFKKIKHLKEIKALKQQREEIVTEVRKMVLSDFDDEHDLPVI
jgi:hypothetical protein